jgi:cation:H+ antiporter
MTIFLLILGLGLLIVGAELLVRGASRLAAAFGISPLVIGLTVVAFGTSSPEMAVSVMSAYAGQADLAVGNVVGSNIFNVLFILGLSAAIAPLLVSRQLIRLDVPIMIGVSVLLLLLALDGNINRLDGVLLFAGIIAYTAFQIFQSRRESKANEGQETVEKPTSLAQWLVNFGFVIGGLAMLVIGSNWLVDGAIFIAQSLGVNELVIGLTIVAAGTSLPEVATSVIASIRGQRDIAVGNVVGSNIFNILAVLGLSSLVAPSSIAVPASALQFDIPVMMVVALACLPIFFTGRVIARWEGFVFLAYYIIYTVYLILAATQNPALTTLNMALIWFVLPITFITLVVLTVGSLRARSQSSENLLPK